MIYKVIDNFIDKEFCNNLIKDGQKITSNHTKSKIHNNRVLTTCTSLEFLELYNKSKYWKDLTNLITSNSFFDKCLKELNIKEDYFKLKNFFFRKKLSNLEIKAKRISKNNVQVLPTLTLTKYILFRTYKLLNFYFFKLMNIIKNNTTVELLFDYSQAGNGYGREIHRDSDERLIVFLLYLNELDEYAEGGNLEVYNYKDKNSINLKPQPDKSECNLIQKISPDAGKLIIFKNDDFSLHAVSEMNNSNTTRHFLYGGFTITSGKNNFIKSKIKMPTNFYMYM